MNYPITARDLAAVFLAAGDNVDRAMAMDGFLKFAEDNPVANMSRCKSCGRLIWWGTLGPQLRAHPFDTDGDSHFSTCPHADKWRAESAAKEAAERNQGKMF